METAGPMSHLFPYRWKLADGYPANGIAHHGRKVFGTFICGGGSTMGYKLAGYDHLGGVEIDPKVATVYKANHKPKHLYVEDIRAFNERTDLPSELFNLDLLDGSPPCSSFSMAGSREKGWGKEKVFREGQAHQRLDDLVFTYVDTIAKLRPKVAILENVKGLLAGNAKAYAKEIVQRLRGHGYTVQVFLLNAATMGVPQMRERCFFIARLDASWPNLVLKFEEDPVPFGRYREKEQTGEPLNAAQLAIWSNRMKSDMDFGSIIGRMTGHVNGFSRKLLHDERVCNTLDSTSDLFCYEVPRQINDTERAIAGTYPLDYDFSALEAKYLIGMTAQIAHQINVQWFSKTEA
jgi:DNA (cytosine-5)-methyltransferase 1